MNMGLADFESEEVRRIMMGLIPSDNLESRFFVLHDKLSSLVQEAGSAVFRGKSPALSEDDALRIAASKDDFDDFVLSNNLALYASSRQIREMNKEPLKTYLSIMGPGNLKRIRKLEESISSMEPYDIRLAVRIKEANMAYLHLVYGVKQAVMRFVPYHQDSIDRFCRTSDYDRRKILDELKAKNMEHWKSLEKQGSPVGSMRAYYRRICEIFYIL